MDPEDGYLYDFGNEKLNFGCYRLYTYQSLFIIDKLYLYKLLSKNWYNKKKFIK